jgi:hypothetical protein
MLWFFRALIVLGLTLWVHWSSDGFSPRLIGAKAVEQCGAPHYRYLGKGKQCFVFESEDGQTVLKFFNRSYFKDPFYLPLLPKKMAAKEKEKRAKRSQMGYELAFQELGEQILSISKQEVVYLTDRAGRHFSVDLSQGSFVEQRKGTAFYPTLEQIYKKEGEEGLHREIRRFVEHIALRISKKIADRDHNVEDNWGYIDGTLFHLDPGRLYRDESLTYANRLAKEWWSTTHRFRKWLEKNHPESVAFFDQECLKASTAVGEIIPNIPNGMSKQPVTTPSTAC